MILTLPSANINFRFIAGGNRMEIPRKKIIFVLSISLTAIAPVPTTECSSILQTLHPFTSTCGMDNTISPKEREAIDQAALEFVQNALGPNPMVAYAAYTAQVKASISSEKFVAMFQQGVQQMGPFKDLHVTHTYLAEVTGGSQAESVVCGNLSSPEGWVAIIVNPGPAQAYVIVEGQTVNNTWVFVTWLAQEQGKWRIQHIQVATATMVGKSAQDLQKIADAEKQKHHNWNAYILYTAALQLAARGPNFQLGIQPEIQKGMGDLQIPHHLQGQPPFTWEFGRSSFKVLNVGPIGVGGKIYLQIDHEIDPWAKNTDADNKNHELISVFAKTYPEYKDAFAGLVVRAHERGGSRGFGTVEENEVPSK